MRDEDTLDRVGRLIEGDARRDAVHFALAPVTAAEDLMPGDHVGFLPGDAGRVGRGRPAPDIGIVDPFLTSQVRRGDRFWLFLYPASITSLRHEWTHPAFPTGSDDAQMHPSAEWIANFAGRIGHEYSDLMRLAGIALDNGEWPVMHDEAFRDVPDHEYLEFWHHYRAVTGDTRFTYNPVPYKCAC